MAALACVTNALFTEIIDLKGNFPLEINNIKGNLYLFSINYDDNVVYMNKIDNNKGSIIYNTDKGYQLIYNPIYNHDTNGFYFSLNTQIKGQLNYLKI